MRLDQCTGEQGRDQLPEDMLSIDTPLRADEWQAALKDHPDRRFAEYICNGIRNGFRIGYNRDHKCVSATRNMISTIQYPEVVEEYIAKEMEAGRVVRVTDKATAARVQISPFGVMEKKRGSGKWRLIVDLSSPEDSSVNDGITKADCSLSYIKVDDVAEAAAKLGKGTLLAKMDVKSAYRIVPVHPLDRPLLGMSWKGCTYVDKALPFGLRSAPKIFTSIADGLEWIARQRGASSMFHYLDDFITTGPPGSNECLQNIEVLLMACKILGVPVAVEKSEGPTTKIVFLGIEVDTVAMVLRLPEDKLERLNSCIADWRGRKCATKREMLSLIGHLSHACKVVKPGRVFLSRLIRLSTVPKRLDHRVRLNREFRSDLEWWYQFLRKWNGVAIMRDTTNAPDVVLTSDASGSWGCGAYSGASWFQLRWEEGCLGHNITVKELIPIVIACAVWGRRWEHQSVLARCDNMAVVCDINSGYCREPEVMFLLRCLHFFTAEFDINLKAVHLPGVHNALADDLSRNRLSSFQEQCPQADVVPVAIPQQLCQLLLACKTDWLQTDWTRLFDSI